MKSTDDVNFEKFLKKGKGRCYIPMRYVFVFLSFLGYCNMYATRMCFNLSMVVMVNNSMVSHLRSTEHLSECPGPTERKEPETKNIMGETYNWDANTQGMILGAIYCGITLSLIPGAVLCEKFGAKWFFGGPVLLSTILTLLIPIAASMGVGLLMGLRIFQGLAQGLTFPAIYAMIAKWSHILERSRFVSIVSTGIHIGIVASTIVTGWLCSIDILGGWPSTFYIFGSSGCIWFVFWAIFVYESPEDHPYISIKELQYLEGSTQTQKKNLATPWKAIFTSIPMWATVIAYISYEFALVIFITEIPTYISTVLHFGVLSDGMFLALGFSIQAIGAWVGSYIADLLRQWGNLSITNIRKLFTAVALFGPAVSLLGVTLSGCHRQLIIGLVTLSTAISGFYYGGAGSVHIDLSPQFAGSTYAIIDLFGMLTGIIGPPIVGAITSNVTTVAQWNSVFYIVVAFQVFAGLIFVAFGSAELQSWGKANSDSSSETENPERKSSEDGIILKVQSLASQSPASETTAVTKG